MANEFDPMRDRDEPIREEEDVVGRADEEDFEDIDDMEDDEADRDAE